MRWPFTITLLVSASVQPSYVTREQGPFEATVTLEQRDPPPPAPPPSLTLDPEAQPTRDALAAIAPDDVPRGDEQIFPERYSLIDGVFTFRGGPTRTGGAFGTIPKNPNKLDITWSLKTEHGNAPWFGGVGWTGQPVIVRWPDVIRHSMPKLGKRRGQKDFVEVIQGSLDGNVYFLDLYTGKKTRPPLHTGNPIKGSVSLDPRGFPLLFVGQGIPSKAAIGLRIYELIDDRQVFFLAGHDSSAPRSWWGAFDSSGLLNRKTDTYVVGGENGLVYQLNLHSDFDPIKLKLKVAPEVTRYRYTNDKNEAERMGVENSLTVVKNLAFFADNSGMIQALDLRTFEPIWAFKAGDDTDATLTVEWDDEHPALYTGCEVDKTGPKGFAHARRLDALTGQLVWDHPFACEGARAPRKIDSGILATNVIGTGDVKDLVFFTLSRCPGGKDGAVVALDKLTGNEVWRYTLPLFSWSSPTALHDETGKTWLLQAGIGGVVRLLDARTGQQVAKVQLVGDIEASPAVFDDRIVLGTRGDRIYGLTIRGKPDALAGALR